MFVKAQLFLLLLIRYHVIWILLQQCRSAIEREVDSSARQRFLHLLEKHLILLSKIRRGGSSIRIGLIVTTTIISTLTQ